MMTLLNQMYQRGLPCILCHTDHQQSHSCCQDCWQQLPWLKATVIRHQQEIWAAHHYRFPIDRIIQKYKYEQQLQYQTLLMHSLFSLKLPKVQAIVPMPISTDRLAERGYNQMLIIAKSFARKLNIPVWQPVIRAAQHSQKGLSRVERLENIEQQFQIIQTEKRKFKRVLIIDDVITTGSSVSALAMTLEQLGCQKIHIACIAAAE